MTRPRLLWIAPAALAVATAGVVGWRWTHAPPPPEVNRPADLKALLPSAHVTVSVCDDAEPDSPVLVTEMPPLVTPAGWTGGAFVEADGHPVPDEFTIPLGGKGPARWRVGRLTCYGDPTVSADIRRAMGR